MYTAKAVSKYVRISPKKARVIAGVVRGLPVEQAGVQLAVSPLKVGRLLLKTLTSAIANAESQYEVSRESLRVLEVRIDEGPMLKRAKPRNKGGRSPILKRMSHFTIVVGSE
jgi:large subunit ribosomal protein L22